MTVQGQRLFEFKAAATVTYITSATAPSEEAQSRPGDYYSIVQDLAWPQPRDDASLEQPAPAQLPPGRLWFQENLLAHTLLFRQMLQPVIKANQLQVPVWGRTACICDFLHPHSEKDKPLLDHLNLGNIVSVARKHLNVWKLLAGSCFRPVCRSFSWNLAYSRA